MGHERPGSICEQKSLLDGLCKCCDPRNNVEIGDIAQLSVVHALHRLPATLAVPRIPTPLHTWALPSSGAAPRTALTRFPVLLGPEQVADVRQWGPVLMIRLALPPILLLVEGPPRGTGCSPSGGGLGPACPALPNSAKACEKLLLLSEACMLPMQDAVKTDDVA